jgi:hypothetical protein
MENPIFGRWMTDAGTRCSRCRLSRYFEVARRNLRSGGSVAANSITLWSSKGERTSSEFAIAMRSTLTRMSLAR